MSLKKILIADDEALIRKLVKDFLKKEGFDIVEAEDGKKALDIFSEDPNFDVIIIDVMMPEFDGWAVCRHIRKTSSVPIIMLTARDQECDELFGFELGADEYITKPFSLNILCARVQSLLKRRERISNDSLKFKDIEIDEAKHYATVKGEKIDLSPKEFELLIYMAKNKGIALSRYQILDGVWGYDYFGDERTVDTHIKRLRLKIGKENDFIQTVRGVGYRFEVSE